MSRIKKVDKCKRSKHKNGKLINGKVLTEKVTANREKLPEFPVPPYFLKILFSTVSPCSSFIKDAEGDCDSVFFVGRNDNGADVIDSISTFPH